MVEVTVRAQIIRYDSCSLAHAHTYMFTLSVYLSASLPLAWHAQVIITVKVKVHTCWRKVIKARANFTVALLPFRSHSLWIRAKHAPIPMRTLAHTNTHTLNSYLHIHTHTHTSTHANIIAHLHTHIHTCSLYLFIYPPLSLLLGMHR